MIDDKRVLVVVPARGGSKGIKLKNLVPINGVPLVAMVGDVVKELDYVDRAVVSTDHPKIAEVAKKAGLDVPFFRPEELSGDFIGDVEVLTHALLTTEELDKTQYDIVIMLQPTSPLRKPKHVTDTVMKLIEGQYDAVWTVSETDTKYHPLKQLVFDGDILDYYDSKGKGIVARQQLGQVFHRNGAAYAITRDCLINKKSIKGDNPSAVVVQEEMVSIDTEFDFKLTEFIIESGTDAKEYS